MTATLRQRHACLAALPVLLALPPATSFGGDNLAAYAWGAATLLPKTSTAVQAGACRGWANYTCGWSDPLGTAALDYAVQHRAFISNLSPDAAAAPDQAAMLSRLVNYLAPFAVYTGWAEPESAMVALLSRHSVVVQCGASNLSFLAGVPASRSPALPRHRVAPPALDRAAHYVVF